MNKTQAAIREWLFQNATAKHEPERWAALIGVEIIDWDGWRKHSTTEEIDLPTFITRLMHCTINPV